MRGTTQDSTRQRKVSCNCEGHFLKGPVDALESIARKGDLEGDPKGIVWIRTPASLK